MKKDNMNPSQKMKESANDKGQMQMSDHDQMHAGKMTDMSMDHEHMHQQTDMASMQMSHHDTVVWICTWIMAIWIMVVGI